MAPNSPSAVQTSHVEGHKGVNLAVHVLGEGRPLLLLHGLFSNAQVNWIKFGHAAHIAAQGFRVIMPDFRVHGESEAPHDPALYAPDILALDMEALVAGMALQDFDLAGFSLGARTTARLVARGMKPRRAVLAGMGLEGLVDWRHRRDFFLETIAKRDSLVHGDPHWLSAQFMKTMKIDPVAAELLLRSGGDLTREDLAAFDMPTLVVCGDEDRDNGSPQLLADLLPNAVTVEVPGTHMNSVTKPDMGRAIADFLAR